jgi:DNA polymerase V
MGLPFFQMRERFPNQPIAVYSSNYALYGDMSARVMTILQQFAPEVEVYSIDEAFVNLAGCGNGDLPAYGQRIRHAVHQWTGIPISIGIGSTKTLAKLANRLAKRSDDAQGVVDLTVSQHQDEALASVPVTDIWGIGRSYARLLHTNGICTALALRDADGRWIRRTMGVVGLRIVWELRGIACVPLELSPPLKKSLMVSRSFGRPITSLEEMREAVATYTTRAAEKLRRHRLAAGILTVFLTTNRFTEEPQYRNSITITLPVATSDTAELIAYALAGLASIYEAGYRYKKAGVLCTGLAPAQHVQMHLFDTRNRERAHHLMTTIDHINTQMGTGAMQYAVAGVQPRWQMRRARMSPRYTTQWDELVVVRAV